MKKSDLAHKPNLRKKAIVALTLEDVSQKKKSLSSEAIGFIKGLVIGMAAGGFFGWVIGFTSRA